MAAVRESLRVVPTDGGGVGPVRKGGVGDKLELLIPPGLPEDQEDLADAVGQCSERRRDGWLLGRELRQRRPVERRAAARNSRGQLRGSCEHRPRPILHPQVERVGGPPALASARARRASRFRPDRRPPGPALRHGGRRHLLRERLLDFPLLGRDAGELPRSSIERQSGRPMRRTSRTDRTLSIAARYSALRIRGRRWAGRSSDRRGSEEHQ